MAFLGSLFGHIFGDSASELEARGDHFAGVHNWRRAADEYRRALHKSNKSSPVHRRLAAKLDEARFRGFDALIEDIHSQIDVREYTYAADQITLAHGLVESEEQRLRLEECEGRLREVGGRASSQAPSARLERWDPEAPNDSRPRASNATSETGAPASEPSSDLTFRRLLRGMPSQEISVRERLGPAYREGAIALWRGDPEHAIESFQDALAQNPEESIVLHDLGGAFSMAGRTREALGIYHRLGDDSSADWQPQYEIARIQWMDGLRVQAVRTIEDAVGKHPRSGYLMTQWGVFLYKLGRSRQAIEKLYLALQLDSFDDGGLYHAIANLHLELGETEKARRGYLKALELKPGSIGTMLDYAEFLIEHKKDGQAALVVLDTATRTLQGAPVEQALQAYRSHLLSKAHMILGEREMALLAITRALEENNWTWLDETLQAQREAVLAV